MISLITFWVNDNEYARLRENEILKNLKRFRLQMIIWSNEEVFDHEKICFLLNFWKTSIFRFSKLLSIVLLRNWILMLIILWRDWIWIDRNFFYLIITVVIVSIEVIDKCFKVISVFELQTCDQLNWFALQFKRMLIYYRSSYFN